MYLYMFMCVFYFTDYSILYQCVIIHSRLFCTILTHIQVYNTCSILYFFHYRLVDYTCSITDDVLLLPGPVLPCSAMAYLWKLLPGLDPLAVDLHHPDRPSPAHIYQARCMKTKSFFPIWSFRIKVVEFLDRIYVNRFIHLQDTQIFFFRGWMGVAHCYS